MTLTARGISPKVIDRASRVRLATAVVSDAALAESTPQFAVTALGVRPTSWRGGEWKTITSRGAIARTHPMKHAAGHYDLWFKLNVDGEEIVEKLGTFRVR